ncbi:MAG: hypothetical protein DMF59_20210 [Acidobacteria bacterium]|nr:MAG: hypothetical protein DMF59_20210 [Acidobacteriota bacterium]
MLRPGAQHPTSPTRAIANRTCTTKRRDRRQGRHADQRSAGHRGGIPGDLSSTAGRVAAAVRERAGEDGSRRAVQRDPVIAAQVEAADANILASAAADKLIALPNDQTVQEFYNKNKARFESADVSHILIAYQSGSLPARSGKAPPLDEAKKKASAVYAQLKAGADFAATAKRVSDDAQSAKTGGHMGPMSHGMLPPELDAQIFAAKPGDVTPPTVSPYGIHIFKVNARTTQTLDQLRAGISQRVRQEKLRDRVEALRKTARVDFDPTFFPATKKPPAPKKPS